MTSPNLSNSGQASSLFTCQKCQQPLKIHSSLASISPKDFNQLCQLVSYEDQSEESADSTVALKPIYVDKQCENDPSGNGFLVIGDSSSVKKNAIDNDTNYRMTLTARLFAILTDQTTVKHPLCEECADFIYDQMDAKYRQAKEDVEKYRKHEEKLKQQMDSQSVEKTALELESIQAQLNELEEEEKTLLAQIESVSKESSEIDLKLQDQKEQLAKMDEDESNYYKEYNSLKRMYLACEDDFLSLNNQVRYSNAQLEKLKNAGVFNISFHIWHSGQFGTINGFRLGRLPNVQVEWSEINAAWGQAALLLYCLARKLNLTFERYRLVPYGNYSFLECLDDKSKQLPLYSSGGFKFMWNTKFDLAMVAFLDCLQQLAEEVKRLDPKYSIPYKIDKGKIEDKSNNSYSVKILSNSEEGWTKGLKCMLTDLKWISAWVSDRFPANG